MLLHAFRAALCMHFSKTYQQLLLTLPVELRDSAIEYRKLKKLINKVVNELNSIGLSPDVLQEVLGQGDISTTRTIRVNDHEVKVIYELSNVADHIEPRLRLIGSQEALGSPSSPRSASLPGALDAATDEESIAVTLPPGEGAGEDSTAVSVEEIITPSALSSLLQENVAPDTHEIIIPLVSDTAFYQLLTQALQYLNAKLAVVRSDFEASLRSLSRSIAHSARPMSSTSGFRPHSAHTSDPSNISVHAPPHFSSHKSDLYAWREIFQMYVDADIFESHQEASRGERSIEESEQRLELFLQRLRDRGLADSREFKVKESREALQTFLHLNSFILDLRKFQFATSEATRKILKKHAKRTALPLAPDICSPFLIAPRRTDDITTSPLLPLVLAQPNSSAGSSAMSLSLLLGQAIGENLLPIIPHIDDYACLICTNIAFKPIRLSCGHLFCVRCLVKMQKRGQGHCPMCRAPNVLSADRSNVDWALLNFMQDWFPVESKQKLRQNEKEVAEEEWEELGIEVGNCVVM